MNLYCYIYGMQTKILKYYQEKILFCKKKIYEYLLLIVIVCIAHIVTYFYHNATIYLRRFIVRNKDVFLTIRINILSIGILYKSQYF